ncbi:P-loop containing nucleoside triphosphate hydrolase protein [Aspergillus lucknowensis]|uniref:P-loop containing nucleoside triphosphate hydrolase protein n=1 Tax=Aspergillus lucknowensis TaxID=176173 RepID=A0ABR4LT60_9EURO
MTSRSGGNDASSMSFRGGRAPGPNDVFIAVMGVTGSGKSSFISLCSGRVVKVGHQLEACTTTVDVYAYDASSTHTVYLIDTPGFDDTNRSDTQVLREIAGWLGDSYKNKILLHGIIYLHRITDIRMQGSAKKNLIMFRQLCGQDALKKVILVTTMWDKVPAAEGARREKELIDTPEFWGWMLGKGSSCHRHNNTEASARSIVARLSNHKAPITTDLQRQLVDEHKSLDQTSAGRELQGELLKEKEKWARERREIEEQMKAAIKQRDREAEQMMREERDRYTKMIKKVENDTGALRSTMNNLLAERDKRVAKMEQQLKRQQADHEAELKRLSERQRRVEREKEELEKQRQRRAEENERRRQREQARQERDQRRPQKPQAPAKPRASAPKSKATGFAPYSVSIADGTYFCVGPKLVSSNEDYPKRKRGSEFAEAACFGDLGSEETVPGFKRVSQ